MIFIKIKILSCKNISKLFILISQTKDNLRLIYLNISQSKNIINLFANLILIHSLNQVKI